MGDPDATASDSGSRSPMPDMAARIAAHRWQDTPLGAREEWPPSLRTAVQICLHSRFPMYLWWGPDQILLYNDAYAPLLGRHHPAALGRAAAAVWSRAWPDLAEQARAVLERGESTWFERGMWLLRRGGNTEQAWFTWSQSPLFDDHGRIAGLLCTCVEDTGHVLAERSRRKLAEERQLALDAAALGAFQYRPATGLLSWDARSAAIFEFDHLSAPLSTVLEVIHPDDRGQVEAMLRDALERKREPPYSSEYRIRLDGDRQRWVAAYGLADFDDHGRPIRLVGTIADITERKRAEHDLRRAQQRLELAQTAGGVGTYESDPELGYATGSEQFYRLFGLPPGSSRLDFATWRERVHPADRDALFGQLRHLFTSGAAGATDRAAGEYRVVLPDGGIRWFEYSGLLERDSSGRARRVVGSVIDVTSRRETEQSLRQSHERLQLALEAARLGDWRWDRDRDRISLSPRAADILGVAPRHELGHQELIARIDPDDRARIDDLLEHAIEQRSNYSAETCIRNGAGEPVWISLLGRCVLDDQDRVTGLIGVVADITQRRREEDQLQRSVMRQQLMMELSDRLRPLTEPEDMMALVATVLGARLRVSRCCYAELDPDTLDLQVANDYTQGVASIRGTHPLRHVGPQLRQTILEGCTCAIDDVDTDPLTREQRQQWHAIESRAWMAVPLIKAGRLAALLSVHQREPRHWTADECSLVEEVAERSWTLIQRARAEQEVRRLLSAEREARARAEEQSRLKDEFLATLSHELRTPLNAILGWIHLLGLGRLSPAQQAEGIRAIERNARAQAGLVDDLLDMSRIVSGRMRLEPQQIDLREIVDAALTTVRTAADGKQIALTLEVPIDLDTRATADPARIQQVLWNLLSNAVKFTPTGGRVTVALREQQDCLQIVVSDTGEGIRPDFLPHLFGRFRQADASITRRHAGLGLGLALVQQLVELHGGTVHAISDGEGRGATFTVSLPRRLAGSTAEAIDAAPPVAAAAETDAGERQLDGVRVLIVEDDADTRRLLATMLEGVHAEVVEAASASDGLQAIDARRPNVVVSDIAMPDCDGYEFMRRLRARSPDRGGDLPAIALTAFAAGADVARAIEAGYQEHLSKPVDPARLIRTIGTLAGRAAA